MRTLEDAVLGRRLARERRARLEAERLLEEKSLELFSKNEELSQAASYLDGQRRTLEDALKREKELSGLQRQFVSMVSHEFRTPLALIDGQAQRMLRRSTDHLSERESKALSKIRNAVVRLTDLMDSVLSAARLEDGRIKYEPKPCSIVSIIQDVGMSYAEIHEERCIHLEIDDLPETMVADGKLLRQVFSNFLSNAIKYSPGTKDVWITGKRDGEGAIVVSVRDEGVGIPQSEQKKIFDRFFRASTSTGIAGTGIGLHLSAHLVELHSGSIELESEEGQGTTFRVRLPLKASIESAA